jgi:hypothetical protein
MKMTALTSVTDYFKKQPLITAAAGFAVGLFIGWFAIGWGVWPVKWTNAAFSDLHPTFKQEYVRTVAGAYASDFNTELAARRIQALGPDAGQALDAAIASAQNENERLLLTQLKAVAEAAGALTPAQTTQPSLLSRLALPLVACLGILVVGGVGALLYLRTLGGGKSRTARPAASKPYGRVSPTPVDESGAAAPVATPTGAPPVARFMTTYTLGDDVYDDSFSVDGPDGNFLGECGMGISETIGVGDPKKVTAFEVWLFDKNDIRTVTKVIMSEHAFRDEALKSRLAAKGEPVQAVSGDTVTLETATLIVTARVVDMAYGGGALPPNSFFERLTIELAAFKKPAPAA